MPALPASDWSVVRIYPPGFAGASARLPIRDKSRGTSRGDVSSTTLVDWCPRNVSTEGVV
eukprot:718913-Prorocentrum_minimum.AAC.4